MKIIKTKIQDLIILEPTVFGDDRGYFFESFNKKRFEQIVGKVSFVQDNESKSSKGILRGLHFQKPPFVQAKLVRCIEGRVLDIAVDLRNESKTYGQHIAVELSCENKKQLFIPRGFAHGFLVLSETAIFAYKVDNYYDTESERGIKFSDDFFSLDLSLSLDEIIISEKDKNLPSWVDISDGINF